MARHAAPQCVRESTREAQSAWPKPRNLPAPPPAMFVKRLFDRHVAMRCLCVKNVGDAVRGVLTDSNLPLRLFDPIMEACGREPTPTAFGVSQAITLAAQRFSPEQRLELEQAAGQYLQGV